jgi:hypothetical protein
MITSAAPTIELPRLENERPERYEARVNYILMGGDRSLEGVRQKIGKGSVRRIEQWSAEDHWVEQAARYDQMVYTVAAQGQATKYRADLEAHREKAMTSAKNLLALANGLTRLYADALQQPQKIKGADGKTYTLHKIAVDTNTLTTISKATVASLDLEAHALGIDTILGKLDDDSE